MRDADATVGAHAARAQVQAVFATVGVDSNVIDFN